MDGSKVASGGANVAHDAHIMENKMKSILCLQKTEIYQDIFSCFTSWQVGGSICGRHTASSRVSRLITLNMSDWCGASE